MPVENRLSADNPRYTACHVLRAANVPCVVFFEDADLHYGVPTMLFHLYLLVPEIEHAADILSQKGWFYLEDYKPNIGQKPVDIPQIRMLHKGGPESVHVVLLPAAAYLYTFRDMSEGFFPRLPDLVDALMQLLLTGDDKMQFAIRVHLAYLYGHVPELKAAGMVEHLMPINRQAHLDLVAGGHLSLPFAAHNPRYLRPDPRGNMGAQGVLGPAWRPGCVCVCGMGGEVQAAGVGGQGSRLGVCSSLYIERWCYEWCYCG